MLARFHDFAAQREDIAYPGKAAHGYVPGRSILTNAQHHVGAAQLLNADIRDFFPSITTERVAGTLLSLGLKPSVASDLSRLVTIDDRLALGLPPSPLMANLVCAALDARLITLAERTRCTYTRYADDLTFSGDSLPSRFDLASELSQEGFELAEEKFRVSKRGQSTFVTGLSVSDPARPHVPKRFKRALRQELYFCEKFGIDSHVERRGYGARQTGLNQIDGRIQYLRGIERALGLSLQRKWEEILRRDGHDAPVYSTRLERLREPVTIFVDETLLADDALMLVAVVVEDVGAARAALQAVHAKLKADPFTTTRKRDLSRKGLHFTDLSADAQQRCFEVIRAIPCRAFAVVDAVGENYAAAYIRLLDALLRARFVALDRRPVEVVVEENSEIVRTLPNDRVGALYATLAAQNSRRPFQRPLVQVTGKQDAGLWLADGLAWALRAYGAATDDAQLTRSRFEMLRHAYRLVHDLRTRKRYARKLPLSFGSLKLS